MRIRAPLLALALAAALAGCDRNVEPYDADEKPQEPDLSKIFPEGAQRAARIQPGLPEPPGQTRGAPALAQEGAASGGAPITGTIRRAEGLEAPVPSGAVLFLIARRGSGGPPLAVKRIANPVLPLEFSLGPDDRMIQSMPFAGPLLITARIDADGNATSRQAGDLQGSAAGPHEPGASGVEILLDEVL